MGVLRPFSSRETARTAANHLEALSLSFSISLSLTHSRGALDYFNREITQSRRVRWRGREGRREREWKRKKERGIAGTVRGEMWHDMWVLKIEHPKQP